MKKSQTTTNHLSFGAAFMVMTMLAGVTAQDVEASINRSGSSKPFGVCRDIHPEMKPRSHWCKKGPIQYGPSHPSLKYGRQTVYSGPLGVHQGWCGRTLKGNNSWAGIAVSTKYINLKSASPHSPYCGQCMCIRIKGADKTSNPYPPKEAATYFGKVLKGRVQDLCPECEDDHIDILADRPYTFAPEDKWNPKAKEFNAVPPTQRLVPRNVVYGVGIWRAEWQFVSCRTDCNKFFAQYPFKTG